MICELVRCDDEADRGTCSCLICGVALSFSSSMLSSLTPGVVVCRLSTRESIFA